MQKREENNLQFILHIMIIDLEIVLRVREVPADLFVNNYVKRRKENHK